LVGAEEKTSVGIGRGHSADFQSRSTDVSQGADACAARRGTGKAATGQDIYAEAIQEYLARHAVELMDVAKIA